MRRALLIIIILTSMVLAWASRHHVRYMLWTELPISRDTRIIASREPIGFGTKERWVKFQAPPHRIESITFSKKMLVVEPSVAWKTAPDFLDFRIGAKDFSSNLLHRGLTRFDTVPQDLKVYFHYSNPKTLLVGWALYYSPSEKIAVWERIGY